MNDQTSKALQSGINDDETVKLLSLLVSVPSVNIAFRQPGDPDDWFNEARLGAVVADWLRQAGIAVEIDLVAPERPNVIARIKGVGGGPSMIWDAGTFSPDEGGPTYFDDRAAAERELRHELNSGKISVTLRGKKLKGSWALIHTKPATNEWLIIKHRDEAARVEPDVTTLGRSVASDLDIDQLRALAETDPELHERSYSPALLAGSREGPLRFVQPMLATAAPVPARHDGWSFEPKLDGIRVLASVDHGRASLRSRGGHDITAGYPAIASALARQPVATCLFDGEIVAIAANGRPSFELLQQRMNLQGAEQIAAAERDIPVVYYVFDILHLDGYELCGLSLADRREVLARVVLPSARVSEVVTIHAPPAEAFSIAVSAGFEGIVAKRDSSRYEAGRRSPAWLKRKALDRDTFVVGGYTAGLGSRGSSFGGLLIGQPGEGGLSYCGRVGGGFTGKELDRVFSRIKPLASETSPFATPVADARGAHWLRPELRIVVEYTGITAAGALRTPIFKGFADEVSAEVHTPPADVSADTARALPAANAALLGQLESAKQKLTLEGDGWSLPVTNLDKVLWPATDDRPPITKRDLLRYAITIAPLALPHLRDRPLTLLRFPNGIDGKKFYQRHWDTERPPFVDAVSVFADGENTDRNFLCCNTLPALLWLCQVADIEWHASLARTSPEPDGHGLSTTFSGSAKALESSTLNYPDFLLFDLDPYIFAGTEKRGEEPQPNRSAFEATCGIAHALKKLLDALGLESFVKTSGATGVHVYVPVERQFDYTVIRAAANTVCAELAAQRPKEVTLEWATERRTGKVFLDANQNARHKSLAAPYSPRAKPGGPVSLPQRWGDLGKTYTGDLSLLDPVWAREPDPWAHILSAKHNLAALLAL